MTGAQEPRKIVAVFGGNSVSKGVIPLARWTGGEIANCGFIILSGSEGPNSKKKWKPDEQVKDVAIDGGGTNGRWIGVLNNKDGKPAVVCADRSILVSPQMANQRNFLEAKLSDASIVFEGGTGTASEAVSMLCLGKPVLLVEGKSSKMSSLYQLFEEKKLPAQNAAELVDRTRRKLGLDGGPMKDEIEQWVVATNLSSLPACSGFVPTTSPDRQQAIHTWLEGLQQLAHTGEFPNLEQYAEQYGDLKRCYDRCLKNWAESQ